MDSQNMNEHEDDLDSQDNNNKILNLEGANKIGEDLQLKDKANQQQQ
jgi:hypothetical protein